MSQCEMILNHIQEHGSITDLEAYTLYSIRRPAARVFDLRKRGIPIVTKEAFGKNRFGINTKYGIYVMGDWDDAGSDENGHQADC